MDSNIRMNKVNKIRRENTNKSIIGKHFQNLFVIGESAKKAKNGTRYFWCQCTRCGNLRCAQGAELKKWKSQTM